jgi:hypothetical protein
MPFQVFTANHKPYGKHYMLRNIKTSKVINKHFKTKEKAISFAKNAIMFSEKKKSKVVGNKIMPI